MTLLKVDKSETAFSIKMTVPVFLWAAGKSLATAGSNGQLDAYRAALSHYNELKNSK